MNDKMSQTKIEYKRKESGRVVQFYMYMLKGKFECKPELGVLLLMILLKTTQKHPKIQFFFKLFEFITCCSL